MWNRARCPQRLKFYFEKELEYQYYSIDRNWCLFNFWIKIANSLLGLRLWGLQLCYRGVIKIYFGLDLMSLIEHSFSSSFFPNFRYIDYCWEFLLLQGECSFLRLQRSHLKVSSRAFKELSFFSLALHPFIVGFTCNFERFKGGQCVFLFTRTYYHSLYHITMNQ